MQRGHLNASDTVLTDADTGKTGFQVALAVGADTVKVKVTGELGNTMDTDTVVVTRGAPGNTLATGKPSITGTAQVGMTLTAGPGDLADADGLSGVSYSYQWRRAGADGMDIPGATSSTCTLTAADADKEIKVWADFTDDGGTAERRISEATLPVTDATVSRAPSGTVTVDYATSDGTAPAGSDSTATSGTLSFAAGETEKTVSVPVLDDAHDEGSETLTLTLSNPSGAYLADGSATGTINHSDHMPLAWMVRFGRTVGSQVVDALGQRLGSDTGSHVTVGGISLIGDAGEVPEENDGPFGLPEWAKRAHREESEQSLTANQLLLGSAFHLASEDSQAGGADYTAWDESPPAGSKPRSTT